MKEMHASAPKTLAGLRRALARPGAAIIGVKNDLLAAMPDRMAAFQSTRPIVKVQGNGFYVRQPNGERSWMDFGKAAEWSFEGDLFSRTLSRGVITYRLSTLSEAEAR